MTFFILLLALALDFLFGEPKCFHPLVGFGNVAMSIEKVLNQKSSSPVTGRILGFLAVVFTVIVPVLCLFGIYHFIPGNLIWVFDAIVVTLAIGHQSLREHAQSVLVALKNQDISLARKAVAMIVSRDTSDLNDNEVSKAAIESVLENGSDAIFAALFWYIVAGIPGIVIYRLVNTLDAMWGYRTPQFLYFGWFCARLDDVMNYIPARLTAFSYAMSGNFTNAMVCWKTQSRLWYSINAGVVMATGAGALNIQLGGDSDYHGTRKSRPILGQGSQAQSTDIDNALKLVLKAILIWLLVILLFDGLAELSTLASLFR